MVKLTGAWGSLLAIATLALSTVSAQSINEMLSTPYDFEVFMNRTQPMIQFKEGKPLLKTIEKSGNTPLIIGINIDDTKKYQQMSSIGVGITDASSIALHDVRTQNPQVYCEILNMLFSQKKEWLDRGGAGLNAIRTPLGGSDFSTEYYSFDDPEKCGAETDEDYEYFDVEHAAPKLWTVMRDIVNTIEHDSGTKAVVSMLPWTPPAWIKDNKSYVNGGSILEKYEKWYAGYLARAISELKRLGIEVDNLSLQESPQHSDEVIPTTKMPADQQIRLALLFKKANTIPVNLCTPEASWDTAKYADDVLSSEAGELFNAVCWQGYSGKATEQMGIYNKFPNKEVRFTEITTTLDHEPWLNLRNGCWKLLVNAIEYMTSQVYLWNGVLKTDAEMKHTSPSLPRACKTCSAPILIFPEAQGTLDSQTQGDTCSKSAERVDWNKVGKEITQGKVGEAIKLIPKNVSVTSIDVHDTLKKRGFVWKRDVGDTKSENTDEPVDTTVKGTANKEMKKDDNSDGNTPIVKKKKKSAKECFANRKKFSYRPARCENSQPLPPRHGLKSANIAPSGYYARTSDLAVLGHLSNAVRARDGSDWAHRIEVKGTETKEDGKDWVNGRIMAQAFEAEIVGTGQSRFSVILFNWNDNNLSKYEKVTARISFRGKVADVTTEPGVYTISFTAPSSGSKSTNGLGVVEKSKTVLPETGNNDVSTKKGSTNA